MGTLGQRLAQNIDQENRAAQDSAAALSQMRTEEARRKFQTAQRFFEDAKTFFVEGIMSGTPTKELYVQVGGARFASPGRNTHQEFEAVLEGYNYTGKGPNSLYDPNRFASLWSEFQTWAREEGLSVRFQHDSDGGGMEGWWTLRIEPAKS